MQQNQLLMQYYIVHPRSWPFKNWPPLGSTFVHSTVLEGFSISQEMRALALKTAGAVLILGKGEPDKRTLRTLNLAKSLGLELFSMAEDGAICPAEWESNQVECTVRGRAEMLVALERSEERVRRETEQAKTIWSRRQVENAKTMVQLAKASYPLFLRYMLSLQQE